ncbi:hypothetical protein BDD12DRAFT_879388 [Trichophaea hybrida]|nr:hypothetical protein BDD12DRAFT_879388 [Trichophaea hybrida]
MTITPPRSSPPHKDDQTPLPLSQHAPSQRDLACRDDVFTGTLSPPTSSPPPVSSTDLLDRVANFLCTPRFSNDDYTLHLSQLPPKLRQLICDAHRSYTFKPVLHLLRIHGMVRPVHSSVERFIVRTYGDMREAQWFVSNERDLVDAGVQARKMPRTSFRPSSLKKPPAWEKTADACINYNNHAGGSMRHSLVVEVGFSEGYEELVEDAKQWLTKCPRSVQLVVLVKVDEDRKVLRKRREEDQKRVNELLWTHGTYAVRKMLRETHPKDFGDRKDVPTEGDETESEEGLYEMLERDVVADDWVGPLAAYLELWRVVDRQPSRIGERIQISPDPVSAAEFPRIRITDICGGKYNVFPDRTWQLDIQQLHQYICDSKTVLATYRALDHARPRQSLPDVFTQSFSTELGDADTVPGDKGQDGDDADLTEEDEDMRARRKRVKLDELEAR